MFMSRIMTVAMGDILMISCFPLKMVYVMVFIPKPLNPGLLNIEPQQDITQIVKCMDAYNKHREIVNTLREVQQIRVYLESLVTHNNGLLEPKVIGNYMKVAFNYV